MQRIEHTSNSFPISGHFDEEKNQTQCRSLLSEIKFTQYVRQLIRATKMKSRETSHNLAKIQISKVFLKNNKGQHGIRIKRKRNPMNH